MILKDLDADLVNLNLKTHPELLYIFALVFTYIAPFEQSFVKMQCLNKGIALEIKLRKKYI